MSPVLTLFNDTIFTGPSERDRQEASNANSSMFRLQRPVNLPSLLLGVEAPHLHSISTNSQHWARCWGYMKPKRKRLETKLAHRLISCLVELLKSSILTTAALLILVPKDRELPSASPVFYVVHHRLSYRHLCGRPPQRGLVVVKLVG